MRKASTYFSDEQRKAVEQKVAEAERKTSAEIVPVVATVSGRYDRAEDIVGLWLGVIGLIAAWWMLPAAAAGGGSWGGLAESERLLIMVVATVAGFVMGVGLASRVAWLRLLFIPKQHLRNEVAARARVVFFDNRVYHTTRQSGLLIYVSLFERMAAVLADESVMEKLGQDGLNAFGVELTANLRNFHPADAICRTIDIVGERLALVLPRSEGDANQLSDALVILDR